MASVDEIQAILNRKLLQKLYMAVERRLYLRPTAFHIFVTEYNAGVYLEKCLGSIASQKTTIPYYAYVVDDASDDGTTRETIARWKASGDKRFIFIENGVKIGKAANLLKILESMSWGPEDVCMVLDGDDAFLHEDVLQKVADTYQETGCWLTYGSYQMSNGSPACCARPLGPEHTECERSGVGLRRAPWVFSHLFSAKAHLWHALDKSVAYKDGEPLLATSDMAFNYSLAELAGCSRISYISDRLVWYNVHNPLNDSKIQLRTQESLEGYVRGLPPLKKLEEQRHVLENLVVFGVRGRKEHMERTYHQLVKENEKLPAIKRAAVMLVEHSPEPEFEDWCRERGVAWCWIRLAGGDAHPLGQFNRSLAFDVGVLYGPAVRNYLFMDSDLLVPTDFWAKVAANMRAHYVALQPFAHRAVFYMNESLSKEIMADPEGIDIQTIATTAPNGHFGGAGAKGGATYMSYERFMQVGGFDPQVFWGYAPEDQLFWKKLEAEGPVGYADDPAFDLLHLWHPPAVNTNPLHGQMAYYWMTDLRNRPAAWYKEYNKAKSAYMRLFKKVMVK